MNPLTDDGIDTEPNVWLVELSNEQMAAFWEITRAYEQDTFGNLHSSDDGNNKYLAELRSLQSAVESARPVWE